MTFLVATNPDSAKNFDNVYTYGLYVVIGIIGFVLFLVMIRPDKYILINNKIYKHPKINDKTVNYMNISMSAPLLSISGQQNLTPGIYTLHKKKTFGTYFKLNSDMNKPVYFTILSWKPENDNIVTAEMRKKTDYFLDDDGFQKFRKIYNLKDNYIKIKNY